MTSPLQLPPAVGSSGQFVETVTVTSSQQRHVMVLGDGVSTAYAPVTSSAGALVNVNNPTTAVTITNTIRSLSSGTVTLSSNPTIISASSGVVQALFPVNSSAGFGPVTSSAGVLVSVSSGTIIMSSVQSVTATFATNPWSSAPGFNMPIVSASSGIIQLSSAPLVIVASSGGTIPVTLSTVFSLSSVPTVTATAATNPWSSAPGFNVPIVSASSGLIQLSSQITVATTGTLIIVSASSGFVQAWLPTQTGAGFGQVTSSGGVMTGLGVNTAAGYGTVTSSWGVMGQPAFSQSSGRLIVVTSVGKISSAPGVLTAFMAYTTDSTSGGPAAFIRFYDQTTNNATSSSNSGLAGASWIELILSSVGAGGAPWGLFPYGIKFATACSFDLVIAATSTAANAVAGWVSAHYTS